MIYAEERGDWDEWVMLFVADTYEIFHLTGDHGILDEVDDYVRTALA